MRKGVDEVTHILQLISDPNKNVWAYCSCGAHLDMWVSTQQGIVWFQTHLKGLMQKAEAEPT